MNIASPIIHFRGDFAPDRVLARTVDRVLSLPTPVVEMSESAWRDGKQRLGDKLFDGAMARLDSWTVKANQLHLTFSRTGYKHFFGTNLSHPELADQFGLAVLANPLGISALVETVDGHLLMGRRGAGVAFHAHRVHPLGGTVEEGRLDVFAEIARELEEEAGLAADKLVDLRCVGLAEDPAIRQPELMFHAKAKLPLHEIRLGAEEHDAMWSVPCDVNAVKQAATENAELTPIAAAALLLWLGGR